MPSKLVTSFLYSPSPSNRLTLVFTKWPATTVAVAAADGTEDVVVAVVAAVAVRFNKLSRKPSTNSVCLGWTGSNTAPIRNSRW